MTLLRRLLLLIPIGLLAAACSSADTLATVNDSAISKTDLASLRSSYEDPATADAETLRSDLSLLIVLEALHTAATDQFGVEITDADIAERLANPPERYAESLAPPGEFAEITQQAVRASAIQSLVRDAVVSELVAQEPGGFEAIIAQRPQDVTQACVKHIATGSIEEATEVLERLQAGEDFASVAAEVSLDQTSPGGLIQSADGECLIRFGRAGEDFAYLAATAPLNEPAGPVVSGSGWDVIVVTERVTPSLAELAADPMEYLAPDRISALYSPWASEAIGSAVVDVSPTVGRWSEAGVGVVPPGE